MIWVRCCDHPTQAPVPRQRSSRLARDQKPLRSHPSVTLLPPDCNHSCSAQAFPVTISPSFRMQRSWASARSTNARHSILHFQQPDPPLCPPQTGTPHPLKDRGVGSLAHETQGVPLPDLSFGRRTELSLRRETCHGKREGGATSRSFAVIVMTLSKARMALRSIARPWKKGAMKK